MSFLSGKGLIGSYPKWQEYLNHLILTISFPTTEGNITEERLSIQVPVLDDTDQSRLDTMLKEIVSHFGGRVVERKSVVLPIAKKGVPLKDSRDMVRINKGQRN